MIMQITAITVDMITTKTLEQCSIRFYVNKTSFSNQISINVTNSKQDAQG